LKYPEFAKYWACKLGANSEEPEKLSGGINNQVYLCRSEHGNWVIKGYPVPKPGQRDRMKAEVDFLRYSAHVAQGFAPVLVEVDTSRRCTVMEHIQGDSYPEGCSPCESDLKAAFEFIHKLNSDMELAAQMIKMDAADGFLSLRQHMTNVRERMSAMGTEHLPHQYQAQARIIIDELYAHTEIVEKRLESKINSSMVEDTLSPDGCCVSPSDFGFHNAIRMQKGVKFIDFEFAGWDDPCKLCVDFVLQQRNPVPLKSIDIVARLFPGRETIVKDRIYALTEILSLKWLCIIMGILDPNKLSQMASHQCYLTSGEAVISQLRRYYDYCERMALVQIM